MAVEEVKVADTNLVRFGFPEQRFPNAVEWLKYLVARSRHSYTAAEARDDRTMVGLVTGLVEDLNRKTPAPHGAELEERVLYATGVEVTTAQLAAAYGAKFDRASPSFRCAGGEWCQRSDYDLWEFLSTEPPELEE